MHEFNWHIGTGIFQMVDVLIKYVCMYANPENIKPKF